MPKHHILQACGVRRGFSQVSQKLKRFFEKSNHVKHSRDMIGNGSFVHQPKMAQIAQIEKKVEALQNKKRRPSPLHFNF